jgi:hypothetical protein
MAKSKWTQKRAKLLKRDKKGKFKKWKGGSDSKKTGYTHHGTMVHIGKQFKKQNGRAAKVGDVHRTKRKDGKYHGNAPWYVFTQHGWRKAKDNPNKRKPSKSQIQSILKKSRKGSN